MSRYCIIRICQRAINIINGAQEGASSITETRGSKGQNAYLFQHQGYVNKMDSEYFENYV